MKAAEFWNIDNVRSFRNFDVVNGEVTLTDDEYVDYIDECYDLVSICGISMSQGAILKEMDNIAFRCGKSDYESQLTSELESQLENEDDSDIEFIEGIDEDEEDEE